MIFVRREKFRQYVRFYPANTALLGVILAAFVFRLAAPGMIFDLMVTNDPRAAGEYWRYVTAIFLHADWTHLLFNVFSLFVFAPPLELLFGSWRYALFFLACGIIGNIGAIALAGDRWFGAVGASGAIYGVFGAYLYMALFRKQLLDPGSRTTVLAMLALGLLFSLAVPHVSFWAHVFGALAGFALYALTGSRKLR